MANARKEKKIKKDYVAVLLEDLRSQFRIFGESLEFVRKKGEATFDAVGELQEQVSGLALEIRLIKAELAEIKKLLMHKVDIERLEALEKRVAELEKLIISR